MTSVLRRKASVLSFSCVAASLLLGGLAIAANETFVVNSTADTGDTTPDGACDNGSGKCTLREAIQEANASSGVTIQFNIPQNDPGYSESTGTFTITNASGMQVTANGTTIDGTTQANTNANGPEIILRGSIPSADDRVDGITLVANNCTVKGMIFQNLATGVEISGSSPTGNKVQGCYFGTTPDGTAAAANSTGIAMTSGSNNTIGGTAVGEGNLISGNTFQGIFIFSDGNFVQGNIIGLQRGGTARLANQGDAGILLSGDNNTIGGTMAGARNVISGNSQAGFQIYGNNNTIQGNYIGPNTSGTAAVSGGQAAMSINFGATGNLIGGTSTAAANVISGFMGIRIFTAPGNTIQGNYIGVAADGTTALGNTASGISIEQGSTNNIIGGSAPGAGNTIAFCSISGITIGNEGTTPSTGNSIRGNSIYNNLNLGINLSPRSEPSHTPTANDDKDPDNGPNRLQNFPIITSIDDSGGIKTIHGTLNSTPGATFAIDFFANDVADSSGFGEGREYLGSLEGPNIVTTDGTTGNATFSFTTAAPVSRTVFTATATNTTTGDTSEFSQAISTQTGTLSLSINPPTFSEDFGSNAATGTVTRLNSSTAGSATINLTSSSPTLVSVPASVIIPAGQTSVTFTVGVTNDSAANGTRNVTITAQAGGFTEGNTAVTVIDDDNPTLGVAVGPSPVSETAGASALSGTVTRQGSLLSALTVSLAASPTGNITLPAEVVIPAGATSATFTGGVIDNTLAEGTRNVAITASAIGYANGNTTLTINDNDSPSLVLSVTPTTFTETAGAASVTATVTRNALLGEAVNVLLTSNNPRVTVPQAVVIPANALSATFNLTVVDDGLANGPATFSIEAQATGLPRASATVTLTDNDAPLLVLSPASNTSVTEGSFFGLNIAHNLPQPVTITFSSSIADAVAPTAMIISGGSSTTISISTVNDAIAQGTRTATVRATAPGLPPAEVTFTITDNDTPRLTLSIAPNGFSENAGATAATGTLTRNTSVNAPLTVSLSSSNPAKATVPANVTIPAGQSSVTFPVSAVDNNAIDEDQTVTITASAPGFGPATFAVIVSNDDALSLNLCQPVTIPMRVGEKSTYKITVPAAPHLWLSFQTKERDSVSLQATLKLNGAVVPTQRTLDAPGYESRILHVNNPVAGDYILDLEARGTGSVVTRVCTDLPELKIGQPLVRQIFRPYGVDWVQVDVPAGLSQLDLHLETIGSGNLEVFKDANTHVTSQYGHEDIKLSLPDPTPGRYFLRILSSQQVTTESQVRDYSITATATFKTAAPRPAGITPNRGGNNGSMTATITGSNLDAKAKVQLVKTGVPTITAIDVNGASNGTSIMPTFDLTGKTPGVYNVVVTNVDGKIFQLPNAFTVEAGGGPELWTDIIGRETIRAGRDISYTLLVGNRGNVDAFSVPVILSGIPKGAKVKLNTPLTSVPGSSNEAPGDVADVPIAITTDTDQSIPLIVPFIPAGEVINLQFTISVPQQATFNLEAFVFNSRFTNINQLTPTRTRIWPFPPDVTPNQCGLDIIFLGVEIGLAPFPGKCLEELAAHFLVTYPSFLYSQYSAIKSGQKFEGVLSAAQMAANSARVVAICGADASAGRVLAGISVAMSAIKAGKSCFGPPAAKAARPVTPASAYDPNDKIGPAGAGASHYIAGKQPMGYTIFFENKPSASAPAAQVIVTDQLDRTKFDLDTFALGPVSFANTVITPPSGLSEWHTRLDLRPTKPLLVEINARLDKSTGIVTWVYSSLDPITLLEPEDPSLGFLPPNKVPNQGEGSVSFTVQPKTLATGTVIRNQARIFFDANEHIDTPVWSNTIESSKPSSKVLALAPTQTRDTFQLKWSGTDTGSGVQTYTIFGSENNGPYTPFIIDTTATQANFTGQAGKSYRFYSVARDRAGNVEEAPTTPDATTTLSSVDLAITGTNAPNPALMRNRITYTITVTNNGPQAATGVVVTDKLPAGVAFVSATSTVGTSTQARGVVTTNIGNLARGASAVITIIVIPPTGGPITSEARVSSNEPDPNANNNVATIATMVLPYITVTTPTEGASVSVLPLIKGTVIPTPDGGGLARVELLLQRLSDGKFWTGSAWGARTVLTTTVSGNNWSRQDSASTRLPSGVNLPEGAYSITVNAVDRSSLTATATSRFTVDKTRPLTATFTRPVNGSIVNNLAVIAGTATDNLRGGGIGRVQLFIQRKSDSKFWTGRGWGTRTPLIADLTPTRTAGKIDWRRDTTLPTGNNLLNGQYTLSTIVSDRAGNTHTTATITVTVDVQAPTVSFTTPTNNSTTSRLASVSGRVADERGGSGVARVQLFIQRQSTGQFWTGTAWGARTALTTTLSGGTWTRSSGLPTGNNLVEGQYSLQAHAFDRAENRAIAISTITIGATPAATANAQANQSAASAAAPRSSVTLSAVGVKTASGSITLGFTAALDADVASDPARYTVLVNGRVVEVESAAYNASKPQVILSLPEGTLHPEDKVSVRWQDLLDSRGRSLAGEAGPFTAQ